MSKKGSIVLVTGINGFVGKHLAIELKNQGHIVFGTGLDKIPQELLTCDRYFGGCDLTQESDVKKIALGEIDSVVNLAGLAQMGSSFTHEELYMRTNVAVHTVLAKQLLKHGRPGVRVVAISSGAVYNPNQSMPLTETSQLAPESSPYSRSKIAMEEAMEQYKKKGLDVVVARPFNQVGPGQTGGFLIPDLAKQIVESTGETLRVGNLNTRRDYTDVRDVAKAYATLATSPGLRHTTYNVCSGKSASGKEIFVLLKEVFNKRELKIHIDESKFRPNDAMIHYGDNSRLFSDTGWRPGIPLKQTIKDFADWYLITRQ